MPQLRARAGIGTNSRGVVIGRPCNEAEAEGPTEASPATAFSRLSLLRTCHAVPSTHSSHPFPGDHGGTLFAGDGSEARSARSHASSTVSSLGCLHAGGHALIG